MSLLRILLLLILCFSNTSLANSAAARLSDAQIIGILRATHQGEVHLSGFAKSQSENKDVIKFANQLSKVHSSWLIEVTNLSVKNNMRAQKSPSQVGLETARVAALDRLQKVSRSEFDKAYLETEIARHKSFLLSFDKQLVPNARDVELKALLAKLRPDLTMQLKEAGKIHASLQNP